jgi:hypothetical protein
MYNWMFNIAVTVLFYLLVILFLCVVFKWLGHIGDRYLTALFTGALLSQLFNLLFAPGFPVRVATILYFSFFALFIRAFADMQFAVPHEKLLAWVLLPIIMMSSVKMAYTTVGYMRNYRVNVSNIEVLRQASADIKAGKVVEIVEILPAPTGFGINIEHAMEVGYYYDICEFYDLPYDIVIRVAQ